VKDDSAVYEGLEPAELWRHFARLNDIPRPSAHEGEARSYVRLVAEEHGLTHRTDARGNLVVLVPARGAAPDGPVVAVQSHLDMVCEKRSGLEHDFLKDPIRPRRVGEWIFASGTTLGADNGIGAAAALSLITDPRVSHGPLELIFTVEEETGLHGASALDGSLVGSRLMINLDSEDPDALTVGCAGGASVYCRLSASWEAPEEGSIGIQVKVGGLKGGHSGVQIHEKLANAIKLLVGALVSARDAGVRFQVGSIDGGSAHNAIPREAAALLALDAESLPELESCMKGLLGSLGAEWGEAEPDLALGHREVGVPNHVMSHSDCDLLLGFLEHAPHGVLVMSTHFPGTVQTSCNLARIGRAEAAVEVLISVRSFIQRELEAQSIGIIGLAGRFGGAATIGDAYPGWEPDPDSRLLKLAEREYRKVNARPPRVEVIHAGLECGVIAAKLPGMDAISFGPLIRGAHSPDEGVLAPTVMPVWELLKALLRALAP
jgi:dipeptidase D